LPNAILMIDEVGSLSARAAQGRLPCLLVSNLLLPNRLGRSARQAQPTLPTPGPVYRFCHERGLTCEWDLLASVRRTRILDIGFERQRNVWTICKSWLMQCSSDLIRRRACFWPSSGSVCQSSISLSPSATLLELLISMEYHCTLRASNTSLYLPLSKSFS
jgi:hypothetical protein